MLIKNCSGSNMFKKNCKTHSEHSRIDCPSAFLRSVFLIAEFFIGFVLSVIGALGLEGVFFLMLLESTVVPIPSELIMPFAGFLIVQGKMEFWRVVISATLGSIAGSLISYYIGKFLGKAAILKYGKYFLLEEKHLDRAHDWFEKYGGKMVFACRFVPAVRHVISIPAGIAEMKLWKFIAYTAAGAFLWNSFLTIVGMQLGSNWTEISKYSGTIDIIVIVAVIALLAYYIRKSGRLESKSGKKPENKSSFKKSPKV